jgi:putative addiction module CopG family antidote
VYSKTKEYQMHGHCESHHHHGHWAAGRRRGRFGGFGGRHGGGFGERGRFGDGGEDLLRARRMLAQGDLRLLALALIAEAPRHGYEIIKLIEEKTADWYSPSPGIVYPTLTYLEEAGYVTASTEGAKKLYTITEEGRAYLATNRELADVVLDRLAALGERVNRAAKNAASAAPCRSLSKPPCSTCVKPSASGSTATRMPRRGWSKSSPAPPPNCSAHETRPCRWQRLRIFCHRRAEFLPINYRCAMNVSVGERWEAFVEKVVRDGRYGSASEVVREGLRLVEEREAKLKALRDDINAAIEEGGDNSAEDIERMLDGLAAGSRSKAR